MLPMNMAELNQLIMVPSIRASRNITLLNKLNLIPLLSLDKEGEGHLILYNLEGNQTMATSYL